MEEEVKNVAEEKIPQEATQEPIAEQTEVEAVADEKKPRDLFYERIRTNFPDGKYDEDEEEYYKNALSSMDALEKDSKSFKDLTEKLTKRLNQDPAEAEVFLDWLDGVDLLTATARHKGPEALQIPAEGTPEYDDWKKAGDERRKELDEMQAKVEEYRANAAKSDEDLAEFAKENGLTEEQSAELAQYINETLLPKIYAGTLDKDFYKFVQNARNYDVDLEGAREQGRVDGRNEKIEVEKKHLAGSGLPNGATGGDAGEEIDAKPENKTVDWLNKMAKRRV